MSYLLFVIAAMLCSSSFRDVLLMSPLSINTALSLMYIAFLLHATIHFLNRLWYSLRLVSKRSRATITAVRRRCFGCFTASYRWIPLFWVSYRTLRRVTICFRVFGLIWERIIVLHGFRCFTRAIFLALSLIKPRVTS